MTRILLTILTASALAACAAAPPAARPAPSGAAQDRDPALPVAAFIDSAGLHQALLTAPPAPPELKLRPIFSVRYDSTGALESVEPASQRVIPAEYGRTMSALLRAHVKPSIATPRETWQRVWLQSGSTPKIEVLANSVEVRPVLNNRNLVSHALARSVQRIMQNRPGLAGRRLSGTVSLRVSEDGRPIATVLRQSTGDSDVDREIIAVARTMRFSPARIDGYPVTVLVQVPVTFDFPEIQHPATGAQP